MPVPLQDTVPFAEYLPAADTLAALGDSIPSVVETLPPAEVWDAAAVYGAQSVKLVQETAGTADALGLLTGNGWFQILSLVVLGLWCWMIYYYRGQAAMCLKSLVIFKAEDKFTAEHGHLFNRFVNYAVAVMVAATGIMVVKIVSETVDPQVLAFLPGWFVPPAAIMVAALAAAIIALQFGILKLAGGLTFSEELTAELVQTKKMHLAAAAVVAVPAIILFTGLNPVWDTILEYLIIAEVVAIATAFTVKTCILFVRQKVSLLVWILYLCAVEIFPLSLAVLMAVKNV